jgi:hypothetical protein
LRNGNRGSIDGDSCWRLLNMRRVLIDSCLYRWIVIPAVENPDFWSFRQKALPHSTLVVYILQEKFHHKKTKTVVLKTTSHLKDKTANKIANHPAYRRRMDPAGEN